MRTVTFKELLFAALSGLGQEPFVTSPSQATRQKYAAHLEYRLREAWEYAWWPDLMLIEQREYRATWAIGTTYALAAEVYYDEAYYSSLQAANVGKQPDTETTWWEVPDELDRYIAWEQTGETKIGTPRAVSTRNPRKSRYPGYINFTTSENGVQVSDLAPAQVYLEFRRRAPALSGTAWSGAMAYVAGDVVYVDSTGQCYEASASSTNKDPTTETTYWTVISLPWILKPFVALAAYADGLKEDRQGSRTAALMNAYRELARAAETILDHTGQTERATFQGYP